MVKIERYRENDTQTLGVMTIEGNITDRFYTLELPWRDNQKNISRIPAGKYKCTRRYSPKFREHFQIMEVPYRSMILIHRGNFYRQVKGCILVGIDLSDINQDGFLDVVGSATAMQRLVNILPDEFNVDIIDNFPSVEPVEIVSKKKSKKGKR
jgi:hypothetical protein